MMVPVEMMVQMMMVQMMMAQMMMVQMMMVQMMMVEMLHRRRRRWCAACRWGGRARTCW